MWYNRPSEYLLKEEYLNNLICPCIFKKKSQPEFTIITAYIDDLNIIETSEELSKVIEYLKKEFELKDLKKKKLPWFTNWSSSRWDIYSSINLYKKGFENIFYG